MSSHVGVSLQVYPHAEAPHMLSNIKHDVYLLAPKLDSFQRAAALSTLLMHNVRGKTGHWQLA